MDVLVFYLLSQCKKAENEIIHTTPTLTRLL